MNRTVMLPRAPPPNVAGTPVPELAIESTTEVTFSHREATGHGPRLFRKLRARIVGGENTVVVDVLAAHEEVFRSGECGIAAVFTVLQAFHAGPRDIRAMLQVEQPQEVFHLDLAAQLSALFNNARADEADEAEMQTCIVRAEAAAMETAAMLSEGVLRDDLQPDSVLQLLDLLEAGVVCVLNKPAASGQQRPLEEALSSQRSLRSTSGASMLDRVLCAACRLDGAAWRAATVITGMILLDGGHYWALVNPPEVADAWLLVDTMVRTGDARVTMLTPDAVAKRAIRSDVVFVIGEDMCGRRLGERRTQSRTPEDPAMVKEVSQLVNAVAASAARESVANEAVVDEAPRVSESTVGRERDDDVGSE